MFSTTVIWIGPEGEPAQSARELVVSVGGCRFETASSSEDVLERAKCGAVSLVLVYCADAEQEQAAVDMLGEIERAELRLPLIAISKDPDLDRKVRLIRRGAIDSLATPVDKSRLTMLVDVLTVRSRQVPAEIRSNVPADSAPSQSRVNGYLFHSPQGRDLLEQMHLVAPLQSTVLLTGETGTGKTHLARIIHELSPRKAKPFLTVQCGALSPTLLQSELFGHARGAFTSADRDHVGKLAEVGDGTILLDEIDSIPLEAQARLLRAVEERVFEPVGSNRTQKLKARLIVATNRSLEQEAAEGRFRSDLYYRLNVVEFPLAPLRERRELIRPLIRKFLIDVCARNEREAVAISGDAVAALEAFDWPGNVRELRNVIERAIALCPGHTVEEKDLPDSIRYCNAHSNGREKTPHFSAFNRLDWSRKDAEVKRLVQALDQNNHNRTKAARELGISRVTLYKKLHKYGLI